MPSFADNLARMHVAAVTGQAPPDLLRWAADRLSDLAPAIARIEARNALLRQAAALVSGAHWAKARRLEREIRTARSRLRERAADLDGVRELVARALEIDPEIPTSTRQLFRILGS